MSLLVDTTPLRVSPDFRRLWLGLAVVMLRLVQLRPLHVFALLGGAFADSIDKRTMLLGVTAVASACSVTLAVNASLGHPQLWLMFVLGGVASATFAVTFPVVRS